MKIGVEIRSAFAEKKLGIDLVALSYVKQFQKMNTPHRFTVFVQDGPDKCLRSTPDFRVVVSKPRHPILWDLRYLKKAIKRHNLELLLCPSHTGPFSSAIPIVVMFHLTEYRNLFDQSRSSIQHFFAQLYAEIMPPLQIRKAAHILTVSEYMKDELISKYDIKNREHVEVIYNGIDEEFFVPSEDKTLASIRKKYGLPERYILSVASLWGRKNLSGMLRAYDEYYEQSARHFPLVLAGISSDELNSVLNMWGLRRLANHVIAIGYVGNMELKSIYEMAQYFILASLVESFGLPLVEAMACKTPVIAANSSSLPEIAWNCSVLVDPEIPSHIAEAMLFYDEDSRKKVENVEKGYQRASMFTWAKSAEKLLTSLENVRENFASY